MAFLKVEFIVLASRRSCTLAARQSPDKDISHKLSILGLSQDVLSAWAAWE
jgi:hypothetical protein